MAERFSIPTAENLKMYFDSKWSHYIASALPPRPGFAIFAATLEHQFFPPGTPKNADFIILSTAWLHGSVWMTISIPTAEKHLAESVAKFCGLKILDTFPISNKSFPMFATVRLDSFNELKAADPDMEAFPLYQGTNIFSLENSDEHPIRTNQMTVQEWNKYEMDLVKKLTGDPEWTEEDEEEIKKFRDYMGL